MQIHITLTRGESPASKKVADAEVHFDEGPLAGLRLIGVSVEKNDKPGNLRVRLPGLVCSSAGKRREVGLIQPVEGGTQNEPLERATRLESAILDAYCEARNAAGSTSTTTGQDLTATPEVRKTVTDLISEIGIVDTVLAVANECMSRAKSADEHPDPLLAAAWREAGIGIGHSAHELEGSLADYPRRKPKKN